MEDKSKQIETLKAVFEKAKKAPLDEEGLFKEFGLKSDVWCAMYDVGKLQLYELEEYVKPYLEDAHEDLREIAIEVLGWSYKLALPAYREKAYEMFCNDSSNDVKHTALVAWSDYYFNTQNPEVLSTLYQILCSREHVVLVRSSALVQIIEVAEPYENPDEVRYIIRVQKLHRLKLHEDFEKEVNWERVKSIMAKYAPEALLQ